MPLDVVSARTEGLPELEQRFLEAATEVVDIAWSMGVGSDFEFPETEGPRPSGSRVAGWYVGRLQRRARHDPELTEALTRVNQFERPPSSLFRPRVLWRVLSPFHRRRPHRETASADRADSAGGVTASSEN